MSTIGEPMRESYWFDWQWIEELENRNECFWKLELTTDKHNVVNLQERIDWKPRELEIVTVRIEGVWPLLQKVSNDRVFKIA